MLFDVCLLVIGFLVGFEVRKWLTDNKPESIIKNIEDENNSEAEDIRFKEDVKILRKIIGGNLK